MNERDSYGHDLDEDMYDNPQGEGAAGSPVGTIRVDSNPSPIGLKDRAYGYLKMFPEIKEQAQEKKKKIMTFASSHGGEIAIGTLAATIGIVGAIELFRYRKHKRGAVKNPHGNKS